MGINSLAMMGRRGDTALGHLTPGEIVIPKSAQTPGLMGQLASNLRRQGANPASFVVGSSMTSKNPLTGLPEFADPSNFQALRNYLTQNGVYSVLSQPGGGNQPNFGAEKIQFSLPNYDPTAFNVPKAPEIPDIVVPTIDVPGFDDAGGGAESGAGQSVTGGTGDEDAGAAPGSSKGKSRGTSPAQAAANNANTVGNLSEVGSLLGRGLNMATGFGFGNVIGAGIGAFADFNKSNALMESLGMPNQFGFKNAFEAFLSEVVPFSERLGLFDPMQAQVQNVLNTVWDMDIANAVENFDSWGIDDPFGASPSWDTDMANAADNFGGYGGYGGGMSPSDVDDAADQTGNGSGGMSASDVDDAADQTGSDDDSDDSDDGSIICTELMRQGRLSKRLWLIGTKEFRNYWEYGKRGYYLWSRPVVRHLKAHPDSRFSKAIEKLFNIRAEYVAARNGHKRYRKTLTGALVTKGMYGLCWSLAVGEGAVSNIKRLARVSA